MALPFAALLPGLMPLVDKAVSKGLDAILPDNMSEAERANAQLKAKQLALEEFRLQYEEQKLVFEDVRSARDLAIAEAKGDSWIAKNIRPICLAIVMIIVINNYLVYPYTHNGVILDLGVTFKDIASSIFIFFFGGRTIEKAVQSFTNANVQVNAANNTNVSLFDQLKAAVKKK